ncbi:hypothetical protein ACX1C1_03355 [Paenibacillus sp. strain BS8-2]
MRMKHYLFCIGAILLLLLIGSTTYLFMPKTLNADTIFMSDCSVKGELISLQGGLADSANKYRGYRLAYSDHALTIQIKGSLLSLGSSGEFDITIPNSYDDIHTIYVQGPHSTDRELACSIPS